MSASAVLEIWNEGGEGKIGRRGGRQPSRSKNAGARQQRSLSGHSAFPDPKREKSNNLCMQSFNACSGGSDSRWARSIRQNVRAWVVGHLDGRGGALSSSGERSPLAERA